MATESLEQLTPIENSENYWKDYGLGQRLTRYQSPGIPQILEVGAQCGVEIRTAQEEEGKTLSPFPEILIVEDVHNFDEQSARAEMAENKEVPVVEFDGEVLRITAGEPIAGEHSKRTVMITLHPRQAPSEYILTGDGETPLILEGIDGKVTLDQITSVKARNSHITGRSTQGVSMVGGANSSINVNTGSSQRGVGNVVGHRMNVAVIERGGVSQRPEPRGVPPKQIVPAVVKQNEGGITITGDGANLTMNAQGQLVQGNNSVTVVKSESPGVGGVVQRASTSAEQRTGTVTKPTQAKGKGLWERFFGGK